MEDEFEPTPVTGEALILRWAQRDALLQQRAPIPANEVEAIRQARVREAKSLKTKADRGAAYRAALTWEPPHPPNYGSMRDWLDG